jgi:hypothetical protein
LEPAGGELEPVDGRLEPVDGDLELTLRPFQILTLRLTTAGS